MYRQILTTLLFLLASVVDGQLLLPRQADSSLYSFCSNYVSTCPPTLTGCVTAFCASCQAFYTGTAVSSCCGASAPAPCFEAAYTSSPMTDANYASCLSALQIFASCSSSVPNFASANSVVVAGCLCYSSSTWIPDYYDALQSACVRWDSTADPGAVSEGNAVNGYCTRVGNVLSVTASASTTEPATPGLPSGSIVAATSPTSSIAVSTSLFPSTSSFASASSSAAVTASSVVPVTSSAAAAGVVAVSNVKGGQNLLQWAMLVLLNLLM